MRSRYPGLGNSSGMLSFGQVDSLVAVDPQGQKLWLIAVDGKQPLYSEGITLDELAQIVINLGADQA